MRTTILKAIEHPGSFSPSLGLTIPTSLNTWPNTASTEPSGQVASRNEVAPLDPKAKSWEEEPTAQRGSGTKSPSTTAERSDRDPVLGPQRHRSGRHSFPQAAVYSHSALEPGQEAPVALDAFPLPFTQRLPQPCVTALQLYHNDLFRCIWLPHHR